MTIPPPQPSPDWAYFLDVDGTLIDIAQTPDEVFVDHDLLRLIEKLHLLCEGAVALVSGRALADLDILLGMPHLPMAGLHGLEWRVNNTDDIQRRAMPTNELDAIKLRLTTLRQRFDQLIIEDKGSALALHYRQAPRLGSYLHRWVRDLVNLAGKDLQVQPGKRVIEIMSKGYDKGSAIETFMAQMPFADRLPVFIGDDLTDEHGFTVINQMGGLSIKVGKGHTAATCRLRSVAAVRNWLSQLSAPNELRNRESTIAVT
ncbi:MAG: trehalose-phosphatase [Georgfuchsia sp.]